MISLFAHATRNSNGRSIRTKVGVARNCVRLRWVCKERHGRDVGREEYVCGVREVGMAKHERKEMEKACVSVQCVARVYSGR
jgi:hypothetical protein